LIAPLYAGFPTSQTVAQSLSPFPQDGTILQFYIIPTEWHMYAMVGEYDEAMRLLENLMSKLTGLGVGALRLDPAWKPLNIRIA